MQRIINENAKNLHDLLWNAVSQPTDACAIFAENRLSATYQQLVLQVEYIGRSLRHLGLSRSARVAIALPSGPDLAVASLGVATYATCAPLNPDGSADELGFCLEDAGVQAVIVPHGVECTTRMLAQRKGLLIVDLETMPDQVAGTFRLQNLDVNAKIECDWGKGEDIAFVLHTSGTTARPKLVPLSHRQLCCSARNIADVLRLSPSDRCLCVMPLYHIHGLSTLFASIASKASFVCSQEFAADRMGELATIFHPTWYSASPALHRMILDHLDIDRHGKALRGFRFIRSASAPMPMELLNRLEQVFAAPMIEAYGMTEAAPQIASNGLSSGDRRLGSVGRAAGPEVAIMDMEGNLLSYNKIGEVVIRGENVITAYENNHSIEEKAFVHGWLRTGDEGRIDQDGFLYITGRLKDIINRGGEKISPQQIDEVLQSHPDVAEAVTFTLPHPVLGENVGAAVVLKRDTRRLNPNEMDDAWSAAKIRELQRFASSKLSHFKIPQQIYFVDQIPKSLTGKVRRHELAKQLELQFKTQSVDSGKQHSAVSMSPLERCIAETWAGVLRIDLPGTHDNFFQLGGESLLRQSLPSDDFSSGLESGYVEPRNPIEQRLASIWSELLGIKQVGIQDNFFALGGHSLLAARLTSRVSDVFGFRMSVRQLFEHPSIAGQALLIEATHLLDNNGPSIRLVHRPHEVGKAAPLSHAQQRLWFLEQLEGTLTAYNIPRAWRIRGSLDIESLRKALEAIVLRHEPLRTIFKHDGTIPVQIVKQIGRFDLPVLDLLNFDPRVKETQLEQSILSEISRAFDLTCDVMLRAKLLKLGDNEHELLLTMHHIASDGWSIDVLSRELSVLYHHFLETPDGPTDDVTGLLDPLPVNYIDYTLWQRENLSERRIEGLLEYWREELQGLPALELPTDRPRPSTTSYQGSSIEVKLPEGLISKLESLCSSEQVTLQMLLLAAFESLLYRYSHQEDFAIGIPFAGREDSQLEDLIGFFVSTLVIRADLSGEPTFQELLSRVRQKSLAAYDHQALPLQVLLAELQPERHLSRPPLFQVMFQLLNRNEAGLTLQGLEVTDEDHGSNRVKFDLELHLSRHTGDISGAFYYSTDLFDSESIQRMALHYVRILESIAANPNQKVSQLEILTKQERTELLDSFNDTAKDYPRDLCVHELFEQQVQRTPDAVALVFEDQQLTYAELNARANRLARHLRSQGVGIETPVGMCLERSLDLVVSILGILKAGAMYVPLDAEYPKERTLHMIENTNTYLVLTQRSVLNRINYLPNPLCIEEVAETSCRGLEICESLPKVSIQSIAYVIHTSGSTGIPKGVAVSQSSLVNLLSWADGVLFTDVETALMGVAPATFDISLAEFLAPLLTGKTTVFTSKEIARDPTALIEQIALQNNCVVQATPATWVSLLDIGWNGRGCRTAVSTGEALPASVRSKLLQLDLRVLDLYGPTETTIWSTYREVHGTDNYSCIGRPIANTQVYVLDSSKQLVPRGIPGELYIGGDGLARGYLNRPDLTAERFVPNPFSQSPISRLYRTGDLCRWRADGNLEYLGRIDHQVKLRGFRIELGEIESVLANHSSIAQCVVILREDRPGDKRLVAYYIASGETLPSIAQLREHLQASLPEYMIPSAFVLLDALPLTASGKIDRRGLPAPDLKDIDAQEHYTPPRNGIEEQLVEIWQEVLGINQIGIHANFFALGGHSLLAVRLFARIEKAFGRKLPLAILFRRGTIEHLAEILAEPSRQTEIATVLPLQTTGDGRPLFLMPTIGGGALVSRPLFELLDGRFPIFGLQIALELQNLDQVRDFRAMAGGIVTALRRFQPHGPYAIAGFSFGGMMAYEVACQLTELGEQVDLLAIIDTGPSRRGLRPRWSHRWKQALRIGANVPSWIREECRNFSAEQVTLRIRRKLRQFYRQLASRGQGKIQFDDIFNLGRIPLQNRELAQALYEGFRDYIPRPYSGKLTLIRARTGPLLRGRTPDLGWSRFVGHVDIRTIPGNHETIFHPPHVTELARQLSVLVKAEF